MDLAQQKHDRDAVQRMSDAVSLHLLAARSDGDIMDAVGKWIGCRLDDGKDSNELYDTKEQAVRYAPKRLGRLPKQCCYIQIPISGMPLKEAASFLRTSRLSFIDTTAPVEVVPTWANKRTR